MALLVSTSCSSPSLLSNNLAESPTSNGNGNGSRAVIKHPYKYNCPFCQKKYTSRSGLLSHKNTVHFQRKPYRCEFCNQHFHTSATRVGHIRKMHSDQGVVKANAENGKRTKILGSTATAVSAIIKKLPTLAPKPAPSQVPTPVTSETNATVVSDVETSPKQPPPKVAPEAVRQEPPAEPEAPQILYRGVAARTKPKFSAVSTTTKKKGPRLPGQTLSCHMHPPVTHQPKQNLQVYKCLDCLARFEDSDQLVAHVRLSHPVTLSEIEQDLMECFICPGLKLSKEELIQHVRAKHMAPLPGREDDRIQAKDAPHLVKKSRCLHCEKVFPSVKRLRIHMKFQHTEAFRKINSGTSGRDQAKLKSIQKCDTCQQDVATKEQDILHQSLYCSVDFTCSLCLGRFCSVSDYTAHSKACENSSLEVDDDDPGYRGAVRTNHHLLCPICGYKFRSQKGYIAHLSSKHDSEISDFGCIYCSHHSVDINDAIVHAKKHPEADKCDISFVQESVSTTRPRRQRQKRSHL